MVTNAAEMHRAVADDVLGAVLGFQNSTMLGDDPEMAQIFADVGVRVVQLTCNISNHLGASCWEPSDGGLTRAGHRLVAALNDAGVLVDLSHVGNRTSIEAVHASAEPVAITHGNPLWFCDSPRNKPDEVLDAVAERGGVIARLATQVGMEHVAIGTDAVVGWAPDGLGWMRSGRWDRPADPSAIPEFPEWPAWFKGPKDFGSLAAGLDDAGFSPTERDAILGGNWLRLFGELFG